MSSNPGFTDKPEERGSPDTEDDYTEIAESSGRYSSLADDKSRTPSLVYSDWPETSVGAYRMAKDKAKRCPEKHAETVDHDNPTLRISKAKPNSRQCLIISILVVVVIIGAISTALVFLLRKTDSVEKVQLEGQIVLLEDWLPGLEDTTSVEYKAKVNEIQTAIGKAVISGALGDSFESVEVISLQPGSIIVNFMIFIRLPTNSKQGGDGTISVTVEDSGTKRDVTEVIKDSIVSGISLKIETDTVIIRVSVTKKTTPTLSTPHTRTSTTTSTETSAKIIDETTTTPALVQGNETVVFGRVVLNRPWTPALLDPASAEYNTVLSLLKSEIRTVFGDTIAEEKLSNIGIVRLSEGSIVIAYQLVFHGIVIIGDDDDDPVQGAITLSNLRNWIAGAVGRLSAEFHWLANNFTVCPSDHVPCPILDSRGNLVCIRPEFICDGNPDCPETTDERNCSSCRSDQITCDVNKCVPQTARCDGIHQCLDGSDEYQCLYSTGSMIKVVWQNAEYTVCFSGSLIQSRSALAEKICERLGQGKLVSIGAKKGSGTGVVLTSLNWTDPSSRTLQSVCEPLFMRCQYPACGLREMREPDFYRPETISRIARPSLVEEWPWQRSVVRKGSTFCSGIMITPDWMLNTCMRGTVFPWIRDDAFYWDIVYPPFRYYQLNQNDPYPAYQYEIVHAVDILVSNSSRVLINLALVNPKSPGPAPRPRPACLSGPTSKFPESQTCYVIGENTRRLKGHINTGQWDVQISAYRNCSDDNYDFLCVDFDKCQFNFGSVVCLNEFGFWEVLGLLFNSDYPENCQPTTFTDIRPFTKLIQESIDAECVFKCVKGSKCIYDYQFLCDGVAQCDDNSDEADSLCVTSTNCTFEYGDCGYKTVAAKSKLYPASWNRIRSRKDLFDLQVPIRDHSTNSNRGYVMAFHVRDDNWATLGSPKWEPFPFEGCLTFHIFTRNINPRTVLQVYAQVGSTSRLVAQLQASNYRTHQLYNYGYGDKFTEVTLDIPAFTDQILFRAEAIGRPVGIVNAANYIGHHAFNLDDIVMSPGYCIPPTINCSFSEAGLCGYLTLYKDYNWVTHNSSITNYGRHLTFTGNSTSKAYVASPPIQRGRLSGCLSFDFQFDGPGAGRLKVFIVRGDVAQNKTDFHGENIWSRSSTGPSGWNQAHVELNKFGAASYRIVFEGAGMMAATENVTIRLDNIQHSSKSCIDIETTPTAPPITVETNIFGRVELNRTWSTSLADQNSLEYLALLTEFRAEVGKIFAGTTLEKSVIGIDIIRLRPGSIDIHFLLKLRDNTDISLAVIDYINSAIAAALNQLSAEFNWEAVGLSACPSDEVPCPIPDIRGHVVCINPEFLCDGNPDCPETTDETGCSSCKSDQIACDVNKCLPQTARCDGIHQCLDGSDEYQCLFINEEGGLKVVFRSRLYDVCVTSDLTRLSADGGNLASRICRHLGLGNLIRLLSARNRVTGVNLRSLDWMDPVSRTLQNQCQSATMECQHPVCGRRQMTEPDMYRNRTIPSTTRPSMVDEEWPWHIGINRKRIFLGCTGILVAPEWVLTSCVPGVFPWILGETYYWDVSYPPFGYVTNTEGVIVGTAGYNFEIFHIINLLLSPENRTELSLVLIGPRTDLPTPPLAPPRPLPACLPVDDISQPQTPVCYVIGRTWEHPPAHVKTAQAEAQTTSYRNCSSAGDNRSILCADADSDCKMNYRSLVCLNTAGFWEVVGLHYRDQEDPENCSTTKYLDIRPFSSQIRSTIESQCIFKCAIDGKCLYDYGFLCDGVNHCSDGSDEQTTAVCVTSPSCTFEYGSCGYTNKPKAGSGIRLGDWKRSRAREDARFNQLPSRDHSTRSSRGYILSYIAIDSQAATIVSPLFSAVPAKRCLKLSWFSQNKLRRTVLKVSARVSGTTQMVAVLQAPNYRQHVAPRSHGFKFTDVFLDFPEMADQIEFHAQAEVVQSGGRPRNSELIAFALDDIILSNGPCQGSISCSFTSPGLCRYLPLFGDLSWIIEKSDLPSYGPHLVFSSSSGSTGYISSPSHPKTWEGGFFGCLTFEYKFEGPRGGTLSLIVIKGDLPKTKAELNGDIVWNKISPGPQDWTWVKIEINKDLSSSYRVIFAGTGVEGQNVTMRIDNIDFRGDFFCSNVHPAQGEGYILGVSNQCHKWLDIQQLDNAKPGESWPSNAETFSQKCNTGSKNAKKFCPLNMVLETTVPTTPPTTVSTTTPPIVPTTTPTTAPIPTASRGTQVPYLTTTSTPPTSAIHVESPNCTFEFGDCGYAIVRPTHNRHDNWSMYRAGSEINKGLPQRDHTTNSSGGVVMAVRTVYESWSNLASPVFSAIPQERCLRFYFYSTSRDPIHRVIVHTRLANISRSVLSVFSGNYYTSSTPVVNDAVFAPVFVTIPPNADRVFFQMMAGSPNIFKREELRDAVVFAIDDLALTAQACPEDSVSCTFTSPGMCGYKQLYEGHSWTVQYSNKNQGRHLTFSNTSFVPSYISSPPVRRTQLFGCLSLDYQFQCAHGGRLAVYIVRGDPPVAEAEFRGEKLWSLKSSGHQSWRSVRIPLNVFGATHFRVVLEGTGGGEDSDVIRVDNIQFSTDICGQTVCTSEEFQCTDTRTCIPRASECNSVNDCSDTDRTDETSTNCAESFTCAFGGPFMCGYRNTSSSRGFWVQNRRVTTLVRLAGGSRMGDVQTGRVEVYRDGEWRNVCGRNISTREGQVLCRNAGYQGYRDMNCCGLYGYGTNKFWITDLQCRGSEVDVSDCHRVDWGEGNCQTFFVLGITCFGEYRQPAESALSGGMVSEFGMGSRYNDTAEMISPAFQCLSDPAGCSGKCLKVEIDRVPVRHSPVVILGADNSGRKTRLWTSWSASGVSAKNAPLMVPVEGLQRLHFASYYNKAANASVKIRSVEEVENCLPAVGCSDPDSPTACDGIADCLDGRDEWGSACSDHVNVSCTFDGGLCGYSGSNRLVPWGRANVTVIKQVFRSVSWANWILPRVDSKSNSSGKVLFYDPVKCRDHLPVNELIFPNTADLAQGGCLRLVYYAVGNFTLTSLSGHIHHFQERNSYSKPWFTGRVKIPRGTSSLSIIVDCVNSFLLIDQIIFTPGQCSPIYTSTGFCPPGDVFICDEVKEIPCSETCRQNNYCMDGSNTMNCHCRGAQRSCGGRCVEGWQFCNGKVDCPDGSDEELDCSCPADIGYTCTKDGHVSCHSHYEYCPPGENRCEEERGCNAEPRCGSIKYSFRCGSGECIENLYVCDYHSDCADYSDETNCSCPAHDFKCPNSGLCVRPVNVCDSVQHCPGGEDEGPQCLICDAGTEFKCKVTGFCVKKTLLCNGYNNCLDGSDEANCTACEPSGFSCRSSGKCIDIYQRCNGAFECLSWSVDDISDEAGCECQPFESRCNNSVCVPNDNWCDGINHCLDNSDELQCAGCPPNFWRCGNRECIRIEFRCDGHSDCTDDSDETNCLQCATGEVAACGNKKCVRTGEICDGHTQCDDNSDENNCGSLQGNQRTEGEVYFNRSGNTYPLCAENVVNNQDALTRLCYYLTHGSYLSSMSVMETSSTQNFLIYNAPTNADAIFTSALSIGSCSSRMKVRISCRSPDCGDRPYVPPPVTRIIGGKAATDGEWPWMVDVMFNGEHRCGASVINRKWVVTAAHCVQQNGYLYPYVSTYLTLVTGNNRPSSQTGQSQLRTVERVIVHENYTSVGEYQIPANDIAMLKLQEPLNLSGSRVRPICLPKQGSSFPLNSVCRVAGWGMSIPLQRGLRNLNLHHVRVNVIHSTQCVQAWDNTFNTTENIICTTFGDTPIGSCNGDSGGPLMCLDPKGRWQLQGIVSFGGFLCGVDFETETVRPNGFVKVSAYHTWIDMVIRNNK